MIIKSIQIKNFKHFKEKEVNFEKINFISGDNGSGKSTIALSSILFCFYGYAKNCSLKDLPTRNISKSCQVKIKFEVNNKKYEITRKYPTNLTIKENNKLLKFSTKIESQNFINKLLGDRLYFSRFRLIDAYSKEVNFLEEGTTTLKKILFSASNEIFNRVKDNLMDIKRERETLLKVKGKNVHYPSKKRLNVINKYINDYKKSRSELTNDIRKIRMEILNDEREKSRYNTFNQKYKKEQALLNKNDICYTCKQSLPQNTRKRLLNKLNQDLKELKTKLPKLNKEIEMSNEIIQQYEEENDKIKESLEILNKLKYKLEDSMEQSKNIYTEKDVLIFKEALKELDNLSTFYLIETIRNLEPIINSILSKINFNVTFDVNNKGKFAIILQKEGINYNYNDLSCGERLILQIAVKIAILIEKNNTGLVIADEGLGALSEDNLNYIINLFKDYPFQLFMVLHRFDDVPEFVNTINLD